MDMVTAKNKATPAKIVLRQELVVINPVEIRMAWKWVRPQLEEVIKKCHEHFLPEDIYHAVLAGNAVLCEMGKQEGILVVERTEQWGRAVMNCWVCHHDSEEYTVANYWDSIVDLAKTLKVEAITMHGPRAYHKVVPVEMIGYHFVHKLE